MAVYIIITLTLKFNMIIKHYEIYDMYIYIYVYLHIYLSHSRVKLPMLILIVVMRYMSPWLETMSTWFYLCLLALTMTTSLCFQHSEHVLKQVISVVFAKTTPYEIRGFTI